MRDEVPPRRARVLKEDSMTQVLLAGKDWQARALVRAQLIEEGLDVEADETIREAL